MDWNHWKTAGVMSPVPSVICVREMPPFLLTSDTNRHYLLPVLHLMLQTLKYLMVVPFHLVGFVSGNYSEMYVKMQGNQGL